MERVSTHGLTSATLQCALALQARYAEKVSQQSSGLVGDTYGDLGSQASTLLSLESLDTEITTYNTNTTTVSSRVESMYDAVGSMIDLLDSYRSTLSSAMSDSDSSADYATVGAELLEDLASLMNLEIDGRYLFAGSNTDTAPVDTSLLSTTPDATTTDTSYYTGDSYVASVKISSDTSVSYGVTGDNSAFELALRAANVLANMGSYDSDTIESVYELATEALDALTTLQSTISVKSSRLESAATTQETSLNLLDTMISNIKDADTASLAVEVSEYETQLSAAYSALSSVVGLSLTDYL